jgi:translation elongation factor EF-G
MDKAGADFVNCLKQIETKLKCVPLPCHLPLEEKDFNGIIDLVDLTVKQWNLGKSDLGINYSVR